MDAEKIKAFLAVSNGSGAGDGSGYGSGYGYGYGSGYGYGYGDGDGSGYGYGDGSGYGYGSGDGDGYGLNTFNGQTVYMIDDTQTIISHIRGNIAKGKIVNSDLTLTDCYIVKNGNFFAHGETVKEATEAVLEKVFDGPSEEERIEAFLREFPKKDKVVPVKDLYLWHHRLTGSCEMGRKQFAEDHGLNIEADRMTVAEFISLTENAYGGQVIRKLKEKY